MAAKPSGNADGLEKPKGGVILLDARAQAEVSSHRVYLLINFRKSTPPQNRQLIVYHC